MNKKLLLIVNLIFLGIGCKKDEIIVGPITYNLNSNDSITLKNVLNKKIFSFIYYDTLNNLSKIINAKYLFTKDGFSGMIGKTVDPTSTGNSIKINYTSIYYFDSTNDFTLIVKIKPTTSQTGLVRYASECSFDFNGLGFYRFPIHANGIPKTYTIYDSLKYNDLSFYHCNYNSFAMERKLSLIVTDRQALPLYLENKKLKHSFYFFQ